jgi:hypothetical protein
MQFQIECVLNISDTNNKAEIYLRLYINYV